MIGTRSFIFNSRFATCYFRNQLWKSSERVERISQLLLGRDMMKPALAGNQRATPHPARDKRGALSSKSSPAYGDTRVQTIIRHA